MVNVTILDINDNCPMFVNLPYYAVVSEKKKKGGVITKVRKGGSVMEVRMFEMVVSWEY
jgi:hypothetical protein